MFQTKYNSSMIALSQYSSVGKQVEWEAPEKKNQHEQTINSDEEYDSQQEIIDDISAIPSVIFQQPHTEQIESSKETPLEIELQYKDTTPQQQLYTENNADEPLTQKTHRKQQPSAIGLKLFNQNVYLQKDRSQQDKSQMDKSQLDQYSDISILASKPRKIKFKVYSFYYDVVGINPSTVMRESAQKNPYRYIITESIIPLILVLMIFIIIYYIQMSIGDFCFTDSVCACDTYPIRLWSFLKQMILFKLALIVFRSNLLEQLVMGNKPQPHKKPIMEQFILYTMTIGLDFIATLWIGFNEDWLFLIIVSIIGLVVFLLAFRMKDWMRTFYDGNALFFYDCIYVYMISFAFWVIPNLLDYMRHTYGFIDGTTFYLLIYPLLDMSMEVIMDAFLQITQYVELYAHQAQLIIIGVRVGSLMLGTVYQFHFWWALILVSFFRLNNSSMYVTIFFRRYFYYCLPKCFRPITAMSERSWVLKGKNGAYYEHMAWIIFLYYFSITGTSLQYYVKKLTVIQNCQFQNSSWNLIDEYYIPVVIWFVFVVFEFLGWQINKKKRYDNIKWLGGQGFNVLENVLIRCLGWYMFCMAVQVVNNKYICQTPLLSTQLSDMNYEHMNS